MKIEKIFKMIAEFQKAVDQEVNETPTILKASDIELRYELMKEENQEYLDYGLDSDIVEILDACVDMIYILSGTINQHGLQKMIVPAFILVHKNNMTKVGPDGKVVKDINGKVLKPEGFVPVDLKQLFNK